MNTNLDRMLRIWLELDEFGNICAIFLALKIRYLYSLWIRTGNAWQISRCRYGHDSPKRISLDKADFEIGLICFLLVPRILLFVILIAVIGVFGVSLRFVLLQFLSLAHWTIYYLLVHNISSTAFSLNCDEIFHLNCCASLNNFNASSTSDKKKVRRAVRNGKRIDLKKHRFAPILAWPCSSYEHYKLIMHVIHHIWWCWLDRNDDSSTHRNKQKWKICDWEENRKKNCRRDHKNVNHLNCCV